MRLDRLKPNCGESNSSSAQIFSVFEDEVPKERAVLALCWQQAVVFAEGTCFKWSPESQITSEEKAARSFERTAFKRMNGC
jgi:hypothetical protein